MSPHKKIDIYPRIIVEENPNVFYGMHPDGLLLTTEGILKIIKTLNTMRMKKSFVYVPLHVFKAIGPCPAISLSDSHEDQWWWPEPSYVNTYEYNRLALSELQCRYIVAPGWPLVLYAPFQIHCENGMEGEKMGNLAQRVIQENYTAQSNKGNEWRPAGTLMVYLRGKFQVKNHFIKGIDVDRIEWWEFGKVIATMSLI